jgi:3-oxoacyl-[acyl-carrier-protein] synthase-3
MVQAELGLPEVELSTSHGVCSSSMMALKAAYTSLKSGEHTSALVVASELASRLFKSSRYKVVEDKAATDFEAEFLRWMLSDGAGALLLQDSPRGKCFKVEWVRSISYANSFPVCMSVGFSKSTPEKSWQDYDSYAEAEAAGAMLLKQDLRLLDNIVKVGVDGMLKLMHEGYYNTNEIDHFLCHYSSHHFKGKLADMLKVAGAYIPENKWYTNLYERGNTGCASMFIMLDEFRRTQKYQVGEKVLCIVPESGRFNVAYMLLTVVEA